MQRYFLDSIDNEDGKVRIIGDDYHHIVKVMRMSVGDFITAVFPNEEVAVCKIDGIHSDYIEASIVEFIQERRELPVTVTIASSLLKGDKLDLVIQKGTELGAYQFVPFISSRSIVKLDDKKSSKRQERWQKIAKEAAEQSERNRIPEVRNVCTFKQLLDLSQSYSKVIVAYEEIGRSNNNHQFSQSISGLNDGDSLLVIFGPEGGFSELEIEAFTAHQFDLCGLGPRILRAETAPLYALSAISFYFELQR